MMALDFMVGAAWGLGAATIAVGVGAIGKARSLNRPIGRVFPFTIAAVIAGAALMIGSFAHQTSTNAFGLLLRWGGGWAAGGGLIIAASRLGLFEEGPKPIQSPTFSISGPSNRFPLPTKASGLSAAVRMVGVVGAWLVTESGDPFAAALHLRDELPSSWAAGELGPRSISATCAALTDAEAFSCTRIGIFTSAHADPLAEFTDGWIHRLGVPGLVSSGVAVGTERPVIRAVAIAHGGLVRILVGGIADSIRLQAALREQGFSVHESMARSSEPTHEAGVPRRRA